MTSRLSAASLGQLPRAVGRPAYDRRAVTTGIVHLGVGAFHRAHQAAFIDACLTAGQGGWGIVGASLRSPETRDALAPQDGLYTLAVRDGEAETLSVIGSIQRVVVASEDPAGLLDVLTAPATRIVTLTVTEKAYLRRSDGSLDVDHADIRADIADRTRPRTIHGFIIEALARRIAAGIAPFTVLSCDNLPANGKAVRRVLADFAQLVDPSLAQFVRSELSCPSSMVDRIVPATTDADRERISATLGVADAWPVVTEPFCQWVVEDDFAMGRPDWEQFGVTMVDDVTPYEDMKLRLLNGAHSAIAYLGQLQGLETVADAFGNTVIRRFVEGLWRESIQTLPAGLDTAAYIGQLADRFSNTALKHRTAQIANDGSQKLPQRIIAPALELLRSGREAAHLEIVVAAWIAAARARAPGAFADPLDEKLATAFAQGDVPAIFDITGFAAGAEGRGDLAARIAALLSRIENEGVEATLAALHKDDVEK